MTLILVYTLSKTILGHSFFNYILVCMCVHALMYVINIINVCALNIVNMQYLLLHACTYMYGTQEHMLYNTAPK